MYMKPFAAQKSFDPGRLVEKHLAPLIRFGRRNSDHGSIFVWVPATVVL
jgi:hypothetical protein